VGDGLVQWFLRLWLAGMAVGAALWLWQNFRLGLVLLAIIGLLIFRAVFGERRRRQRQGYWVEYFSSGVLRVDEDDFAVVYHEGDKSHWFYGKTSRPPAPDILSVPSEAAWQAEMPEWMREKRGIIIERIEQEVNRTQMTRQVQVMETEA